MSFSILKQGISFKEKTALQKNFSEEIKEVKLDNYLGRNKYFP